MQVTNLYFLILKLIHLLHFIRTDQQSCTHQLLEFPHFEFLPEGVFVFLSNDPVLTEHRIVGFEIKIPVFLKIGLSPDFFLQLKIGCF